METTADDLGELLNGIAILPPRLEDAGLEDCALPPDSIMEAFSRAACALKSRIIPSDGNGCVQDPAPSNGEIPDVLIETIPAKPFCGGEGVAVEEVGGGGGGGGDEVIVVGDGTEEDRLVVLGGEDEDGAEGKKSCVVDGDDGVVGEESEKGHCNDDEEEEGDDKPRLVEELI